MEFINDDDFEYALISTQSQLEEILDRISNDKPFAFNFKFPERSLFIDLLEALKIDYSEFEKKYYYYDPARKLHISESQSQYFWISTAGLVARGKTTTNSAVNSCMNQYLVISLLLEKATNVIKDERVYDIDSYSSGLLCELSPAIFHNLTFYVEVFCKAYLSLTKTKFPHTHQLSSLYKQTVETMVSKEHNNSLFQILVLDPLYNFVNHIEGIPGNFKEQFIKYDDNPQDDSVILFEHNVLQEMTVILELSIDFILEYFYLGNNNHYLETNLYQRMMAKANTEEKKKRIMELYPHLANLNILSDH